jgi:hypothetical protein
MSTPCAKKVSEKSGILEREAEQLLQRMRNLAADRAAKKSMPITQALQEIAGEIRAEEETMTKIYHRNDLLALQAKRNVKDFAGRFKTMGEGLLALLQGSNKKIPGARNSIDYQGKSLYGEFFGSLISKLDELGVLHDFKSGKMTRDIYLEMGARKEGEPVKSATGNQSAFKIAQTVNQIYDQLIARQNRAGAYIRKMPGYIVRQTHDQGAIRNLGSRPDGSISKDLSYKNWVAFITPLIDMAKTTKGGDPEKVMRNIHEGLFSGIHGAARDEADVSGVTIQGSLAKKVSEERVIHFKDADSAYKYNQALGTRDFKEALLNDIHQRTRSIALMENLGPTPESTFKQILREVQEDVRTRDDADTQMKSLRDWKIEAAMNEITGRNEVPSNFGLNRVIGTAKVFLQMSKMGAVTLSSLADRAFLQSEMAFQGMSHLNVLGKQITGLLPRTGDQKQMLRLMGVAMDGLMGNALSRYSSHSSVSGWAHTAQKWFFDLNLLNAWTDSSKATAAELMSAHLGEHSHLEYQGLPDDLKKVLSFYDITGSRWNAMRDTAWTHNDRVGKFITPDKLTEIPDEKIAGIVKEAGLNPTDVNIQRERDRLSTALRTYFQDRIDIAIPTPGVAERKWATMNTQAGTPLGEAVRLLMMFKSFPITIMDKIVARNIYGNGADTMKQWLLHDHRGKFNLAMLMAMGTAAGYLSGVVRDALAGKSPKPLVTESGGLNYAAVNDAAIRGGSLGILGDVLLSDYDRNYKSFLSYAAGPVLSQLDQLASMKNELEQGKNIAQPAGKMLVDNAPFINLFYTRPILDYFVLWNMQEMLSPGILRRRESAVEEKNHQGYFLRPSELINK